IAALLFARWFFLLLPVVLEIPQRIRGQERVEGIFMNELWASLAVPDVAAAGNITLIAIIAAAVVSMVWLRVVRTDQRTEQLYQMSLIALFAAAGVLVLQLTFDSIGLAIATAREAGEELPIWSQIVLISAGVGLLIAAFVVWRYANR